VVSNAVDSGGDRVAVATIFDCFVWTSYATRGKFAVGGTATLLYRLLYSMILKVGSHLHYLYVMLLLASKVDASRFQLRVGVNEPGSFKFAPPPLE
jgi:hypothetical protein